MKKINKIGIVFILIILSLLLTKEVNALGISPGRKTIDFEPKLRKEVTLTLHNTGHRDFRAVILTRGELSKYIELSQNSIEFSADEGEKSFSYEVFLPDRFEKPGAHSGEVVVRELPSGEEEEEIVIGALVAVVSEVKVRVPYPGKYAEATLDILSANKDEDVKFFLRTTNLGEADIDKAQAFIYIYDVNNNLVAVVKTDEKSIKSMERKELVVAWNANVSLGTYRATAILDYDGVILNLDRSFLVGDFFVKLLDISVKNFKLGGVAKFNVLVENLANEEVSGLVAEMVLFDGEENIIANLKSAPEDLAGKSRKGLIIYWDTEGVNEGSYEGKLTLKYGDKSSEKRIRAKVSENKIETEIIGVTGLAISVEEPGQVSIFTKEQILIVGILVLILINISWFLYFRKIKKR